MVSLGQLMASSEIPIRQVVRKKGGGWQVGVRISGISGGGFMGSSMCTH